MTASQRASTAKAGTRATPPAATTVAEYLNALPADRRAVVSAARDIVKKQLPAGYEELVGYGMIMWSVPLSVLPDTYNGHPLCYVALAAQKNYYSLYLMAATGGGPIAEALAAGFKKAGKKLDMGKSCVRFKSLDDLPLDVIGRSVASVPMEKWIEVYHASRKKTRSGRAPRV